MGPLRNATAVVNKVAMQQQQPQSRRRNVRSNASFSPVDPSADRGERSRMAGRGKKHLRAKESDDGLARREDDDKIRFVSSTSSSSSAAEVVDSGDLRQQQQQQQQQPNRTKMFLLARVLPVACLVVAVVLRLVIGSGDVRALIVIDVQNCFTAGGSLAVTDGDAVVPVINGLRADPAAAYDVTVLTQDWHPADHVSFASQHPGHVVNDQVNLTYLETGELCSSNDFNTSYTVNCSGVTTPTIELVQVLWPDHCVMNTTGAELKQTLTVQLSDIIVHKGYHSQIDSYSAFYDNGRMASTELKSMLDSRGVTTVYVVGLATDYCVYYSAKDALSLGYKTYVVLDATRGVAAETTRAAVADMNKLGILIINSTDVSKTFSGVGRLVASSSTEFTVILASSLAASLLLATMNGRM